MIIAAIKTSGTEKILAICKRWENGKLSSAIMCDWNTVPNTLRIFSAASSEDLKFNNFKEAIKYIFSL